MNLNWLANPITISAMLALAGVCLLYLLFTIMARTQAQDRKLRAEQAATERLVQELRSQIHELVAETHERAAMPTGLPAVGLNMQKRAEALRMYRRGSDPEAICRALGLPPAEVALLQKVHRVMVTAGEAAAG
jgi:hypothetical protein